MSALVETSNFLPGTRVAVRGLLWEVVSAYAAGDEHLYRLRCLEGALRGQEREFLVPLEALTPVRTELQPERAGALADWRVYHQAFLLDQALGPRAFQSAQPGRLILQPYQLVPVMHALRMSRPRLLLADGVGLGKTVEAGLILAELIARRRAHRILIVSPPGPLLTQWREEMRDRFGLRFRVLDRDSLEEIRYRSELQANPFDAEALGLVSIDFAKQEAVLGDIERSQWDVVVIDEAHHVTRLSEAGDRDDSQRRRLAEVLARQSDALLLLTATPHDGYDAHFASLVELLDPSLVDGRGALRRDAYRAHVIRRLKTHIRDPKTGKALFVERRVHPTPVAFSEADQPRFTAFQRALLRLIAPHLGRAIREKRYDEVLSFVMLLKRSVSTVSACRGTLSAIGRRLGTLAETGAEEQETRKQRLKTLRSLDRRLARYGTLSTEEERERMEMMADDIAAEIVEQAAREGEIGDLNLESRREDRRLTRLRDLRNGLLSLEETAAMAEPEDPKLARLVDTLTAIRGSEPVANVLVFTEYIDSQNAVVMRLREALKAKRLAGDVLALSGVEADEGSGEASSAEASRKRVLDRFSREDSLILVTTDTTAEGLNLHARCHHLVHLELPYNPNRLEQRNGRIDRFGQTREPQIRYLYLAGTFEERLLLRLVGKYEKQRARLTFVPNTLGILAGEVGPMTVRLLEGIVDEEARFSSPAGALDFTSGEDEDTSSVAYRELLDEIDKAFSGFERATKSHGWLADAGLHADGSALSAADAAVVEGEKLVGTGLFEFVLDAIRAESTDSGVVREGQDGTYEIRLASDWVYGLDELPGYEPESRVLRLTSDRSRTCDADGRPVGFLGRAHPIVQRALDRVRQSRFGGAEAFDRRVSVARWKENQPGVVFTFVGRVGSAAGTLFERVLAVLARRDGTLVPMLDPSEWEALAAPDKAIPTKGQWKRGFADWADGLERMAQSAAEDSFAEPATAFRNVHRSDLATERGSLEAWLRVRADEICGPSRGPVQADLFSGAAPESSGIGGTPGERLASFGTSQEVPAKARREASGVLQLFERREADLGRLSRLTDSSVEPLGMLLLVPETS